MDDLRVRAYNVRFGDAVLVSVPDRDDNDNQVVRHLMVDFGNSLGTEGGINDVFEPIIDDVLDVTGGDPLDMYVMSHEHLDHVQGPLVTSKHLNKELKAKTVWMPGSAHPDYYDTHPEAKKKKLELDETLLTIRSFLGVEGDEDGDAGHPTLNTLLFNNNPNRTADCVDTIRAMVDGGGDPIYVHRELDLAGTHPFNEAAITVWAPEEDTSVYYGRFKRMVLGMAGSTDGPKLHEDMPLVPPRGVDAGAFFDLVNSRRTGLVENLFTIDKANNNSSVVFSLEWKGWKLLFTGDAEERSWKEMNRPERDMLEPIHFLKMSHHGSHNGTPDEELLDKILPMPNPDGRTRSAVVSTHEAAYQSVPDDPTLQSVADRVDVLHDTRTVDPGDFIDIVFPDLG